MESPKKIKTDPPLTSKLEDIRAWTHLLEEHRPALERLVHSKLGSESSVAADDILQEVALAAHATPRSRVPEAKVGAWLRQVAVNKINTHWRGHNRRQRLNDKIIAFDQQAAPETPAEWLLKIEDRSQIRDALSKLSKEDRFILEQKYIGNRKYREIASKLNFTEKTIEYRLGRARESLRKLLKMSKT